MFFDLHTVRKGIILVWNSNQISRRVHKPHLFLGGFLLVALGTLLVPLCTLGLFRFSALIRPNYFLHDVIFLIESCQALKFPLFPWPLLTDSLGTAGIWHNRSFWDSSSSLFPLKTSHFSWRQASKTNGMEQCFRNTMPPFSMTLTCDRLLMCASRAHFPTERQVFCFEFRRCSEHFPPTRRCQNVFRTTIRQQIETPVERQTGRSGKGRCGGA